MVVVAATNVKKIYTLVNVYYDMQKVRIISGNRFQAAVRDGWMTEEDAKVEYKRVEDTLKRYEKEITKDIGAYAYEHVIWENWLKRVRGIGPIIAGGLLANIGDISKFDTVSKLWAYCGLHVLKAEAGTGKRWFQTEVEARKWVEPFVDRARAKSKAMDKKFSDAQAEIVRSRTLKGVCWGEDVETEQVAARRRRGQVANWNSTLKTLCWKIGESFNKISGPYQRAVISFKEQDRLKHPEPAKTDKEDRDGKAIMQYSKGHIHARGKRRAVKLFLSHLWVVWRQLEGLPTREPYAKDYLGHTNMTDPEAFTGE